MDEDHETNRSITSLLVLSAKQVDEVVSTFSINDLVELMAQVHYQLSHSADSIPQESVSIPQRLTLSCRNHNVLLMPSRIYPLGTAQKIVSVPNPNAHPEVRDRGLPGSTVVLDEHTGAVEAIINARRLTALRNAASSLLATIKVLASESRPETLVAFGAGAQVQTHILLFLEYYPCIKSVKVFNRTANERLLTLVSVLREKCSNTAIEGHQFDIGEGSNQNTSLKNSLQDARIIVAATSSTEPLFPSEWVTPGTHLILIGSYTPKMHEVDTDLVKRADTIVVDYKEGALKEAGELIAAKVDPRKVVELGELVTFPDSSLEAQKKAKANVDRVRSSGDVTIFKSVGVGVQDAAIARAVVDRAKELKIGTVISDYDEF